MRDVIALFELGFMFLVLGIIGVVAIWAGLKLARYVGASRRESAMNSEALVVAARQRALARSSRRAA